MTANAEAMLRSRISNECKIPSTSIGLFGISQIDLYLRRFPEIEREASLDPFMAPLMFSSTELAEVVEAISMIDGEADANFFSEPRQRIPYEVKNGLNDLDAEYARAWRKLYLKETKQIEAFLSNPVNDRLKQMYESAAEDLRLKMITHRTDHATFDKLINYINGYLTARDPILAVHARLTRAVVFFMYWTCDIGRDELDSADQAFAS